MPASALELPDSVQRRLRAWACAERPREACGLLLGARRGRVTAAVALANVAPGTERFELDPGGFVRAAEEARARGEEVLGVWHSHPDGAAEPSDADLEGALRGERAWSHVIVALAGGGAVLASFRLVAGRFVREPIRRDAVEIHR